MAAGEPSRSSQILQCWGSCLQAHPGSVSDFSSRARLLGSRTYGKQRGGTCVPPGSPYALLSHKGNGPFLKFKASPQLRSRKPEAGTTRIHLLHSQLRSASQALLSHSEKRMSVAGKEDTRPRRTHSREPG